MKLRTYRLLCLPVLALLVLLAGCATNNASANDQNGAASTVPESALKRLVIEVKDVIDPPFTVTIQDTNKIKELFKKMLALQPADITTISCTADYGRDFTFSFYSAPDQGGDPVLTGKLNYGGCKILTLNGNDHRFTTPEFRAYLDALVEQYQPAK